MIVGENSRDQDMTVNVCKTKQLTNMRASGSDEAVRLEPPHIMTLEQAIEWIGDDEFVEVTPESIRIRKKYLDANDRYKKSKKRNLRPNHRHHNNSPLPSKNLKEPTSAWLHEKSPTPGSMDSSANCMDWHSTSGGPGILQHNRCSMNSLPFSGNTAITTPSR